MRVFRIFETINEKFWLLLVFPEQQILQENTILGLLTVTSKEEKGDL
jgi:hypothetical protein